MKSISNIASVGGSGGGGVNTAILYYLTDNSDFEGYIVRATGLLNQEIYNTELNSSGNGYVEVDGMDRYTIELITVDGNNEEVVEYTITINTNMGCFYYIEIGYTTSTWKGIKQIINHRVTDQFIANGDRFNVEIAGEEVIYLANVNTYGLGEVDFIPAYCLATTRNLHTGNTNVGGWNMCNLRSYFNSTLFESYPEDLKAVISTKDVQISNGGTNGNTLVTSIDKIWLPATYEVEGIRNGSAPCEDDVHVKYPIFVDNNARIRTAGNTGGAIEYWVASPNYSNNDWWRIIGTGGTGSMKQPASRYGILPCFRIAPDT